MATYNTTNIMRATDKKGEATGKMFNAITAYMVKHTGDVGALPPLYEAMGADVTPANKGKMVRGLWTMRGTDWCDMGGRTTFGWVGNIGDNPPLKVAAIVKLAKAGTTSRDMVEALKSDPASSPRDPFSKGKAMIKDLPTKANGKVHANRRADVIAMREMLAALL